MCISWCPFLFVVNGWGIGVVLNIVSVLEAMGAEVILVVVKVTVVLLLWISLKA